MTRSGAVAIVFAFALGCAAAWAWQGGRYSRYANEMQNPAPDPPDAGEKTEYAFARLRYRSPGGWRRGS